MKICDENLEEIRPGGNRLARPAPASRAPVLETTLPVLDFHGRHRRNRATAAFAFWTIPFCQKILLGRGRVGYISNRKPGANLSVPIPPRRKRGAAAQEQVDGP